MASTLTRTHFLRLLAAGPGAVAFAQRPFEGTHAGAEREIEGATYCWAPPGRFRMGSSESEPERRADEGPVEVTLTKGFWISRYEATQGQWTRIAGAFPREQDKGKGDNVPVYWVSYAECEAFCRKLTGQARASGQLPDDWEFRLPTEAQWEYSCRAGTTTATSFGERLGREHANFNAQRPYNGGTGGPSPGQSVAAGSYAPNAWGLCDMHGGVWEWCRDWYHARLPGGVDPDNSGTPGTMNRDGTYSRVRRGGAWIEDGWACRSAMRLRYEPERRSDHIGFRVVAVSKPVPGRFERKQRSAGARGRL